MECGSASVVYLHRAHTDSFYTYVNDLGDESMTVDMEPKEMVTSGNRNGNIISLEPLRRLVVSLVPIRVSS